MTDLPLFALFGPTSSYHTRGSRTTAEERAHGESAGREGWESHDKDCLLRDAEDSIVAHLEAKAAEDRANQAKVEWLLLKPVLRLIQADPHLFSRRPCQTCDAVSAIAGEPFGCFKKRMEVANG